MMPALMCETVDAALGARRQSVSDWALTVWLRNKPLLLLHAEDAESSFSMVVVAIVNSIYSASIYAYSIDIQ